MTLSIKAGRSRIFALSGAIMGLGACADAGVIEPALGPDTATVSIEVTPPVTATPAPVAANPFEGHGFYVDPNSNAASQVAQWRSTRAVDALELEKIANTAQAFWLNGWNADVQAAADQIVTRSQAAGAMPVLVLYNIPQRDCGSYSAGGTANADAYRSWIGKVAAGIKQRKTVIILEPDALAGASCLSAADQALRFTLLRDAVLVLSAAGGVVYIDAGHPAWLSTATAADRLKRAGIDYAQGFSLNVSNFHTNASNASYGTTLSNLVGGKHFVIDSSRNGAGPGSTWCNPAGRALGTAPTWRTNHALIDAFLWIKRPGESDGTCSGGPKSGAWWADYALGMAQRTSGAMLAAL